MLGTPLHRHTVDVGHWAPGYHGDGAMATPTPAVSTPVQVGLMSLGSFSNVIAPRESESKATLNAGLWSPRTRHERTERRQGHTWDQEGAGAHDSCLPSPLPLWLWAEEEEGGARAEGVGYVYMVPGVGSSH